MVAREETKDEVAAFSERCRRDGQRGGRHLTAAALTTSSRRGTSGYQAEGGAAAARNGRCPDRVSWHSVRDATDVSVGSGLGHIAVHHDRRRCGYAQWPLSARFKQPIKHRKQGWPQRSRSTPQAVLSPGPLMGTKCTRSKMTRS